MGVPGLEKIDGWLDLPLLRGVGFPRLKRTLTGRPELEKACWLPPPPKRIPSTLSDVPVGCSIHYGLNGVCDTLARTARHRRRAAMACTRKRFFGERLAQPQLFGPEARWQASGGPPRRPPFCNPIAKNALLIESLPPQPALTGMSTTCCPTTAGSKATLPSMDHLLALPGQGLIWNLGGATNCKI